MKQNNSSILHQVSLGNNLFDVQQATFDKEEIQSITNMSHDDSM